MKRFYDGREISKENLIELITKCSKDDWKNSDLFKETEIACEIVAFEEYEGKDEDVEYILEKLNDGATLFDLENAIANGDWYFMQTETWKTQIITEKGECEMKNIKFELTENSMKWKGTTLYQIKALQAFMTKSGVRVSEGELGGWVEREENLSQEGRAWIWNNAKVCGTAKVYGDAEIWSNATIRDNAEVAGSAKIFGNAAIKGNSKVAGKSIIYGDAEIWGDAIISGCSKVFGDAKIGGDAFISSPDNLLTITPLGKYRVSLTFFKTKENSIKASYNWDIYTLEKFQSIMSDWTEEEIKIAKAAIEILGGC